MTADKRALKALWQEAFGESEAWLDSFFDRCFSPDRYHAIWQNEKAVSALYWFDCELDGHKLAYIYAVATAKAQQGRGLATRLMQETHEILRKKGYAGAILVPGEAELFGFYEKIGYRTATTVREFTAEMGDTPIALRKIDAESYVNLRKQYLSVGSVEQAGESLALLELYAGEDFLLAANTSPSTLYVQELLGNTNLAPQILCALNQPHGHFRTPTKNYEPTAENTNCHSEPVRTLAWESQVQCLDCHTSDIGHWFAMTDKGERPFAMFLPLQETCPVPAYFGLALD